MPVKNPFKAHGGLIWIYPSGKFVIFAPEISFAKGTVLIMVKGVNRQIIEIKSTDNRYFERVLLFVRAGQSLPSKKELDREAAGYLEAMQNGGSGHADSKNMELDGLKKADLEYLSHTRRLRIAVKMLSAAFLAAMAAFVVLLLVYTKM